MIVSKTNSTRALLLAAALLATGSAQAFAAKKTADAPAEASATPLLRAVPDVDLAALQATLDQWDREDAQAPYFVVAEDSGSWTVRFGDAAGKKTGSAATDKALASGFDAVNTAVQLLPKNRTEKLKILVASDMHVGAVPQTKEEKDAALSWSRGLGIYGIELRDYVILDFGGHTLYADSTDGGKSVAPIQMTRQKHISVRNLVTRGHARYTIWCQGCQDVVFDNIQMHMDEQSGLGLRIANRGKDWSKTVYIDNIVATGLQDNAVETAMVDGLWVGRIEATDCKNCGFLINTTTNAVVGEVKGVRCSPRNSKGIYAALRCANYVGPNVHIHKIDAEECGHAFFSVSANHDIVVDEIVSVNSWTQPLLIQDAQEVYMKKATLTNSPDNNHNVERAVEFATGSQGGALPVLNNTFTNFTITGYKYGFVDHSDKASDFGVFVNNSFVNVEIPYELSAEHNIIDDVAAADTTTTKLKISGGRIEPLAYRGYTALKSVTIPAGVTEIGAGAFYGCTGLESVTINSAAPVSTDAFYGCTALKKLVINGKVQVLGDAAFGRTAIRAVTLPETVTTFGSNLFSTATKDVTVASLEIPVMGQEAFFNLAPESTITFTNANVDKSFLFDVDKKGYTYGGWGKFWYGYTRTVIQ